MTSDENQEQQAFIPRVCGMHETTNTHIGYQGARVALFMHLCARCACGDRCCSMSVRGDIIASNAWSGCAERLLDDDRGGKHVKAASISLCPYVWDDFIRKACDDSLRIWIAQIENNMGCARVHKTLHCLCRFGQIVVVYWRLDR